MSASQWKQQPNPGSSRRGPRQLLRKTWVRLTSFVAHGNAKSQAQPDLAYEFFKDCVNSDSGSPLKTPRTSTSTTSSMDSGGSSENTSSSSMRNRRRTVPIDPDLDEDGNRTSDDSTGSSDDTTGLPSLARVSY
jgi:hypothetical protein